MSNNYKWDIVLLEQKHGEDNDHFMKRLTRLRDSVDDFNVQHFGCTVVDGTQLYYAFIVVGVFTK